MSRKPVDIEDLVRMAASELASRRRGEAVSGRIPGAGRGDASLVGRWTFPPGFPSISPMFAPGFASSGAPRRPPGFLRPTHPLRPGGASKSDPDDALTLEAEVGELGADLAKLPAPEILAFQFGFALDLAAAWAHSAGNVANLLWHHGAMGNRPALPDCWLAPRPRLAPNGKPATFRRERVAAPTLDPGGFAEMEIEVQVAALKKRDLYPDGAYGVLDWDPDPQGIVNDRADYLAWRLALDLLAERLSGKLAAAAAMPPAAALAPWAGDVDGSKPRDLFGPGADRVYGRADELALISRRAARARRPPLPAARRPRVARPPRPAKAFGGR